MSKQIEIRQLRREDIPDCVAVLRALPAWFGIESAIVDYGKDLETLDGLVAVDDGRVVGFSGQKRYGERAVEINVIGVLPEYRGKGDWVPTAGTPRGVPAGAGETAAYENACPVAQ